MIISKYLPRTYDLFDLSTEGEENYMQVLNSDRADLESAPSFTSWEQRRYCLEMAITFLCGTILMPFYTITDSNPWVHPNPVWNVLDLTIACLTAPIMHTAWCIQFTAAAIIHPAIARKAILSF